MKKTLIFLFLHSMCFVQASMESPNAENAAHEKIIIASEADRQIEDVISLLDALYSHEPAEQNKWKCIKDWPWVFSQEQPQENCPHCLRTMDKIIGVQRSVVSLFETIKNDAQAKNNPVVLDQYRWNRVLVPICRCMNGICELLERNMTKQLKQHPESLYGSHIQLLEAVQKELLFLTCTLLNNGVIVLKDCDLYRNPNFFKKTLGKHISLLWDYPRYCFVPDCMVSQDDLCRGQILVDRDGKILVHCDEKKPENVRIEKKSGIIYLVTPF